MVSFLAALRRLSQGDAILNQVAELIPFGIYIDDPSQGCVYANSHLLNLFDRTWEEFSGYGWARFVHPGDVERFQEAVARYEHTLEPIVITYRILRPSGEVRWVSVRVHAIQDGQGRHLGSVGLASDVTGERELRDYAAQRQQLEQVGRLAGRVAHDFNNLLSAILSSADLLEHFADDPREVLESAQVIQQAVASARQVTGHLLTLSGREVGQSAVADLDHELRGLQPLLSRTLGETVELELELSAGGGCVPLSSGQLGQVVVNLALNGRDALQGRGRIRVRTRAELEELWLEVEDSGSGMDAETLRRCREPFFSTKGARGTGLGLATVSDLVEVCGGRLEIDSSPGQGTRVRARFPALGAGLAPREEDQLEPPARGDGLSLLFLEDHDALRQAFGMALGMHGYRVTIARDLLEARAALAAGERWDAAVLDVLLPDGAGTELLDELWATNPDLPVVLVSGFVGDADVEARLRDPRVRFLPKPFRTAEALRSLQAALASAR